MSSPQVSVIIPNYNGAKYLKESIDSALNQTGLMVEVIVVDDGSTDHSREILEEMDNEIRIFYQENKGAPTARNLGWRNAKAEYIKFLDSDDKLVPGALYRQMELVKKLDLDQIPFGDVLYMNHSGDVYNSDHKYRTRFPNETALEYILINNPLTSSPLHHKLHLEQVSGFNPTLPKGQEWDLHLRLFLAGYHFYYHPDFIYKFREYSDPGRFSNLKYAKDGPDQFLLIFNHQLELISKKHPVLNKEEAGLLAKRYWAYGRAILREGFEKSAAKYFKKGLELAGNQAINGSLLYKTLSKITNPFVSEKFLMKFK